MDEINNENKREFLKPPIIKNQNNYPKLIIKNTEVPIKQTTTKAITTIIIFFIFITNLLIV